ncbi:MAG: SLC13 family permease [Defluviitaleaceae bacterium]|nr:SLC13 family permease [Defluviitaleaceae bacterium]
MAIKRIGSTIMFLLAGTIIAFQPIQGLEQNGQIMLGAMLAALCIWIFKPFGLTYAIGGLVLALTGLVIGLDPVVVFSGFTQTALWTLIPAFFFGYTLQKTGLGKRIALSIIKLCRPTYTSLIFTWVPIGVVLSILTPATTVRVAIIVPIAVQCCELFDMKKNSRGNSLIILTAFAMALVPGSGWLTGVIWGPFIQGQINNAGMVGLVTFNSWLQTLLLPVAISTILLVALGLVFIKPEQELSKEAFDKVKNQPVTKMHRHEIITAIILSLVFAASLTGGMHGLSTAVICIIAMLCFFLFGVLETKDFNAAANWNLVVFIAMALGLGSIFAATGISAWLSGIVVPALAPIAGNPWLFVMAIMCVMFVWSLVDVAMFIPTIAILVPILPDIQEAYGISPLVWVAMFILAGNAFFLAYQNMWAVMSRSIAEDKDRPWRNRDMSIYGVFYFVSCIIALLFTIPLWINLGFFGG